MAERADLRELTLDSVLNRTLIDKQTDIRTGNEPQPVIYGTIFLPLTILLLGVCGTAGRRGTARAPRPR
jgi:hypothetical protein